MHSRSQYQRLASKIAFSLLFLSTQALSQADNADPEADNSSNTEENPAWQWLERGHQGISHRVGVFSYKLDNWLAGEAFVLQDNKSVLQIRTSAWHDSESGNEGRIELGGSLELPSASERWKLIFKSRARGLEPLEQNALNLDTQQETSGAIRFEQVELDNFRIDHDLGLKGELPLTPYYSLRLRYGKDLSEKWSISLGNRWWLFSRGEGLGVDAGLNLSREFGEADYFSWSNRFRYRELDEETESITRLNWTRALAAFETLSLETGAIRSETTGLRSELTYLKGIYRYPLMDNWFFMEATPQFRWNQEPLETTEFRFTLTLEMQFFAS